MNAATVSSPACIFKQAVIVKPHSVQLFLALIDRKQNEKEGVWLAFSARAGCWVEVWKGQPLSEFSLSSNCYIGRFKLDRAI